MRVFPINIQSVTFKSINNLMKKERNADYRNHPVLSNPNVNFFSNYTKFFRPDVPGSWKNFIDIIDDFFHSTNNVNVYCFGCSDGSECYSFIMELLDRKGEKKAKKYFPVKAYDIDSEMISLAKRGFLPCSKNDKDRIKSNLSLFAWYCNFVEVPRNENYPYNFSPKDKVKNKVEFSVADFVEKIDEIKQTNNLILCRNLWYYLGTDKIPKIIDKLSNKIDDTSLIVIGDFDRMYVLKLFKEAGFEEISTNVFRKQKLK